MGMNDDGLTREEQLRIRAMDITSELLGPLPNYEQDDRNRMIADTFKQVYACINPNEEIDNEES